MGMRIAMRMGMGMEMGVGKFFFFFFFFFSPLSCEVEKMEKDSKCQVKFVPRRCRKKDMPTEYIFWILLSTHPKWQQWIWGYDAYDVVDRAVLENPFPL